MDVRMLKVLPILGGLLVFLVPVLTAHAVLFYRVDRIEAEAAAKADRLEDVCDRLARIEGKLDILLARPPADG